MDVLPRLAALGAVLLLAACSSSGVQRSAAPSPLSSPSPSSPAASTATPSAPPSAAPSPPADPTYVALGDSVAAGTGARDPVGEGYVAVLARLLADRSGCGDGCPVRVRNLAVPGATTASLLREQLPVALELLRRDDVVRTVTVTVGGNDVFVPVLRACAQEPGSPSCTAAVAAAVAAVDVGVDRLLTELAGAAGPGTTVAVMTYYDPLPACRLASLQPLAARVLEGTDGTPGLNDVLRARALEHGAVVAETGTRLSAPEDFVGGLDCLHPSTSGHARVAEAFADVVAAD